MLKKVSRLSAVLGACALVGMPLAGMGVASAQSVEAPQGFPKRPLTLIVPYGAGGGSDQLSRAMSKAMGEVADIDFQVVNKPGGGGTAAIPDFMLAPADGYTMLQHIDNAVSSFAKGDIRENPAEDWIPLCTTQITFSQIYIRPDETRFTDWASFVDYAKANPGDVTMANLGKVGSMELVVTDLLVSALGLDIKQIAFDKPAERYGALIGKQVDVLFEQPGDVRQFLESGEMKPILTFLPERPEAFKDVPVHSEVGADFEPLYRFRGFYVRKGVPAERVAFLEAACAEGFKSADYQAFNKSKYMDVIDSYRDSAGTVELINASVETYQEVYKAMGLTQ